MRPSPRRRRINWLDVAIIAAVVALMAFVAVRVNSVLRYDWDWSSIPNYILRYDAEDERWVAKLSFLFGRPELLPNFVAGLIALAMFEGAYVTEIVRAGIQAIDKGQWEAARSLGLSRLDILRDVILPQAVRRVVPPLANQFISLIKDSSIIALISIQELTFMAIDVVVATFRVFEVWITVAAMYFIICAGFSIGFDHLERRMGLSDGAGRR